MVYEAVRVRNSEARALPRQLRCLRKVEIIGDQSINNMVREVLRSGIRGALRRTIPCFGNLQTRTDLRLVVRNVFDLISAEYRDGRGQILTEDFTLVVADDDKRIRRDVL